MLFLYVVVQIYLSDEVLSSEQALQRGLVHEAAASKEHPPIGSWTTHLLT